MATFEKYYRCKKFGIRPFDGKIYGTKWYVEKGQEYDLIKISIKEIDRYYWEVSLAVPCTTSDNTVEYMCKEYVKSISEQDIREYKGFLEDGEKWGWD